jgi:hypothetical protein
MNPDHVALGLVYAVCLNCLGIIVCFVLTFLYFNGSYPQLLQALITASYTQQIIVICIERNINVIGQEFIEPWIIHFLHVPQLSSHDLPLFTFPFKTCNDCKPMSKLNQWQCLVFIRLTWNLSQFLSWVGWTVFMMTNATLALVWMCISTSITLSLATAVRVWLRQPTNKGNDNTGTDEYGSVCSCKCSCK